MPTTDSKDQVQEKDTASNIHIPVLIDSVCLEMVQNNKSLFFTKKAEKQNATILTYIKTTNQDLRQTVEQTQNLIFDGTLGGGGYLLQMIQPFLQSNTEFTYIGGDADLKAINRCKEIIQQKLGFELAELEDKFHPQTLLYNPKNKKQQIILEHGNFGSLIKRFDNFLLDAIVLDLGFSSNQLEIDQDGFSYLNDDQNLDLRYDTTQKGLKPLYVKLHAIEGPKALSQVLYNNSGEELSSKIAHNIIDHLKAEKPLKTVLDLKTIVFDSIPKKYYKNRYSILSRIWQALRIWVNDELNILGDFLPIAMTKLSTNGRLGIVNFHSLEDKIITKIFRTVTIGLVIDDYGNKEKFFEHITQKAIIPTPQEIEQNPRSRSAKLRIVERIGF